MTDIEKIVAGLSDLEKEWLTGWQGPGGAAFNAIGESMAERGLTISRTNWNLNETGLEACAILKALAQENEA